MPRDVMKAVIRMVSKQALPAISVRDLQDVSAHKACRLEGANARSVRKKMQRQKKMTVCQRCPHAHAA